MPNFFTKRREAKKLAKEAARPPLFPIPVIKAHPAIYSYPADYRQFNFPTPTVDGSRLSPPREVPRSHSSESLASTMSSTSSTSTMSSSSAESSRRPSSTGKAARSAIISALTVLGKAPLPGIDAATTAVIRIVSVIQDMSDSKSGWQQLAERLERLWFLISQISETDVQGRLQQICAPLIQQLHTLADDMQRANERGLISRFFNSTDDVASLVAHREELDSIIIDLTATLGAITNRSASQLRDEFRKAVSQLHQDQGSQDSLSSGHGMITRMSNNNFSDCDSGFGVNNKIYGGRGVMIHEMHGNTFGNIRGGMFSGNIVDSRY
ncbi:hypothetical protein C8J56DRAFT_1022658 [Mycena floridula]|nr:hypothetical protein C8J56DRAFT_1022658 [Mycena floridula]